RHRHAAGQQRGDQQHPAHAGRGGNGQWDNRQCPVPTQRRQRGDLEYVGAAVATAPYTATVSPALAQGSYQVRAIATDTAGNATTSAAVGFTVDTAAPAVGGVAPADGATGVAVAASVSATFSEAMDPATLTA